MALTPFGERKGQRIERGRDAWPRKKPLHVPGETASGGPTSGPVPSFPAAARREDRTGRTAFPAVGRRFEDKEELGRGFVGWVGAAWPTVQKTNKSFGNA